MRKLTFLNFTNVLQTVNTASRMETNSAPNRIHVSASTADLIIAADKGYVDHNEIQLKNLRKKASSYHLTNCPLCALMIVARVSTYKVLVATAR